jgi:N-hydroxyarylamine O-acetyltransferase
VVSLPAYFDRIGLAAQAPSDPDLERLSRLVHAHTASIPFENLNALMRAPVRLDLDSLEAKLVRSPRGGYCFEQNALFAAVLEQIGYSVRRLSARVVWGASAAQPWQNPRTHMVLLVDIAGQRYLCDVGFGGNTPTAPLLFELNTEQSTPHEVFRIIEHGEVFLLQISLGGQWKDVYLFDLQPQSDVDYAMANHYVATHPASHFRFTLVAARPFEGGRYALHNRRLITWPLGGDKRERRLGGCEELVQVLSEHFGISVPDIAAFDAALENIREA